MREYLRYMTAIGTISRTFLNWIGQRGFHTPQEIWEACDEPHWMISWMLGFRAGSPSQLRLLACDFANRVLRYVPKRRYQLARHVIAVSKAYARGKITDPEALNAAFLEIQQALSEEPKYAELAAKWAACEHIYVALPNASYFAVLAAAQAASTMGPKTNALVVARRERQWQTRRIRKYFPKAPRLNRKQGE